LHLYFSFFFVLLCHALAALGFGRNLYRFALKSGHLSSTKARGSLLLCLESIRSSSRKHGDYPGVARQFCVPTHTRFHTNLIILISKHNHVLDMIILFPSSTPIVNPFYFLHQLPLPRVNSWLYQPSEIKDIISPSCGSYRIYSTS
jgi:hypothetical protein